MDESIVRRHDHVPGGSEQLTNYEMIVAVFFLQNLALSDVVLVPIVFNVTSVPLSYIQTRVIYTYTYVLNNKSILRN